MRIVFMGTPEFAATILEDLLDHHEVCAVYTRPDAVRGRGSRELASPVKEIARAADIPVCTPKSLRDAQVQEEIRAYESDVICVAAYGIILPQEVLDIPGHGCLNVHASLLPRWRGAAPVERAILEGDGETGVCIMRMGPGLDEGDYCVCRTAEIEDKTAEELSDELANLGSHALLTALVHLEEGHADWIEQDADRVTYASKIEKNELALSFGDSVQTALRKVRASSSAHPARCVLAGRAVTLLAVGVPAVEDVAALLGAPDSGDLTDAADSGDLVDVEDMSGGQGDRAQGGIAQGGIVPSGIVPSGIVPGRLLYRGKRLFMAVADGLLEIKELKPDGKTAMSARAFTAGIQGVKTAALSWEEIPRS